jgi:hypothetical protein
MKTNFLKLIVHVSWLVALVAVSCQKDGMVNPPAAVAQAETQTTAHDNSQMIAVAQDAMDVTGSALATRGISNARYSAGTRVADGSMATTSLDMDCAPSVSGSFSVDRTHKDSVIYSGSLTIDFGTGTYCKDSTEVRKGKMIDTFKLIVSTNDSVSYNLTEMVTFQGYSKDTVTVDGTFTSVSTSDAMSKLTIQNAKITYKDGTSVSWNGSLTNKYVRIAFQEMHQESREVTGSISGTNRKGTSFSATISKAIVFDYSCSRNIPVSGTVDLTVGTVSSTIDFGSGTCDKVYTITTGGTTTTYTFKRHHHDA